MSTVSVFAARVRGAMVGTMSGAAALTAHGVGGGMLPSTGSLVMLVSGCAAFGLLCSGRWGTTLPAVTGQLAAGQVVGHLLMTVASGHGHALGASLTPTMISSHLLFAVLVGIGLWTGERLIRVLLTSITRWFRIGGPTVPESPLHRWSTSWDSAASRLLLLTSGAGTRGPPAPLLAA